jgi:prepilin-type N-terminal cleavage/methylation domain-containing protein
VKTSLRPSPSHPAGSTIQRRAFTLTETMVAMAVFAVCLVGVVSAHIFGLRMYNIAASKLSASDNSRKVTSLIRNEIRQAKLIEVGSGGDAGFTNAPDGGPQCGNALRIFPTTATNDYVLYYGNAADQTLRRLRSGAGAAAVIARYVTNQVLFQAEDYAGNVLTNDQNNRIISLRLEFWQWEFPVAQAGLGGWYDYNRLQTKTTRRAIE